jgi:hypothetical protein
MSFAPKAFTTGMLARAARQRKTTMSDMGSTMYAMGIFTVPPGGRIQYRGTERVSLLENRILKQVEVSSGLQLKFKFKFARRADVDGFALRWSSRSLARRSSLADSNGSSRGDSECGGTERNRSPVALRFQSLNSPKEQPKEQPKIQWAGAVPSPESAAPKKSPRNSGWGG